MWAMDSLEAPMRRSKTLKPINLVMACSSVMLVLGVIAWMTSNYVGAPFLHPVGTGLFLAGAGIAFLPLFVALVAMLIERIRNGR